MPSVTWVKWLRWKVTRRLYSNRCLQILNALLFSMCYALLSNDNNSTHLLSAYPAPGAAVRNPHKKLRRCGLAICPSHTSRRRSGDWNSGSLAPEFMLCNQHAPLPLFIYVYRNLHVLRIPWEGNWGIWGLGKKGEFSLSALHVSWRSGRGRGAGRGNIITHGIPCKKAQIWETEESNEKTIKKRKKGKSRWLEHLQWKAGERKEYWCGLNSKPASSPSPCVIL